ncbi:hypothetical protein E4U42_008068, partial [Claviceps africana]
MMPISILLLLMAALVFGLPSGCCAPNPYPYPNPDPGPDPDAEAPSLPQIEGASNLPPPPPGSRLVHIALGFGLQNYT